MKRTLFLTLFLLWVVTWRCGAAEREVQVTSADGTVLAGTLTVPDDNAPRAVVVMLTGSGAQTRDEEVMGRPVFKVIAQDLARRGYATLRCDDRGVGGSGGDAAKTALPECKADALAMLEYVQQELPGMAAGLLGHSMGGSAALQAVRQAPRCDFLITIGVPAWSGDSIVMEQCRALATATVGSWQAEAQQRRYLDIAKSPTPDPQARLFLKMALMSDLGDVARMPGVEEQIDAEIAAMVSPEYRAMLRYDPTDDIRAVNVPWLALNGTLDMQVVPANLETIHTLNPKADTRLLQSHNHLLQRATTGLPTEYATLPDIVSPEALAVIVDWLDTAVAKK